MYNICTYIYYTIYVKPVKRTDICTFLKYGKVTFHIFTSKIQAVSLIFRQHSRGTIEGVYTKLS